MNHHLYYGGKMKEEKVIISEKKTIVKYTAAWNASFGGIWIGLGMGTILVMPFAYNPIAWLISILSCSVISLIGAIFYTLREEYTDTVEREVIIRRKNDRRKN